MLKGRMAAEAPPTFFGFIDFACLRHGVVHGGAARRCSLYPGSWV